MVAIFLTYLSSVINDNTKMSSCIVGNAASSFDMYLLCFLPSAHALTLHFLQLLYFIIVIKLRDFFFSLIIKVLTFYGSKVSWPSIYPRPDSNESNNVSPYLFKSYFTLTCACFSVLDSWLSTTPIYEKDISILILSYFPSYVYLMVYPLLSTFTP